jgi:hypothetical protein
MGDTGRPAAGFSTMTPRETVLGVTSQVTEKRRNFMLKGILAFGLLGLLALIVGCAAEPTGSSSSPDGAASNADRPKQTDKAAPTKEVTLSLDGMT